MHSFRPSLAQKQEKPKQGDFSDNLCYLFIFYYLSSVQCVLGLTCGIQPSTAPRRDSGVGVWKWPFHVEPQVFIRWTVAFQRRETSRNWGTFLPLISFFEFFCEIFFWHPIGWEKNDWLRLVRQNYLDDSHWLPGAKCHPRTQLTLVSGILESNRDKESRGTSDRKNDLLFSNQDPGPLEFWPVGTKILDFSAFTDLTKQKSFHLFVVFWWCDLFGLAASLQLATTPLSCSPYHHVVLCSCRPFFYVCFILFLGYFSALHAWSWMPT